MIDSCPSLLTSIDVSLQSVAADRNLYWGALSPLMLRSKGSQNFKHRANAITKDEDEVKCLLCERENLSASKSQVKHNIQKVV